MPQFFVRCPKCNSSRVDTSQDKRGRWASGIAKDDGSGGSLTLHCSTCGLYLMGERAAEAVAQQERAYQERVQQLAAQETRVDLAMVKLQAQERAQAIEMLREVDAAAAAGQARLDQAVRLAGDSPPADLERAINSLRSDVKRVHRISVEMRLVGLHVDALRPMHQTALQIARAAESRVTSMLPVPPPGWRQGNNALHHLLRPKDQGGCGLRQTDVIKATKLDSGHISRASRDVLILGEEAISRIAQAYPDVFGISPT